LKGARINALAIFGVLVEKTWLLAAGQAQPWLDLPGGAYFPTWVEILSVLGMVALGVILYLILVRFARNKAASA
jgi:molybdopterin-containing oxidoreductase family membrane subunit